MDITIQHPWFKRALGPLIPSRLFDQFFGEGLFEYDLLPLFSSTISPYYRQSLFRSVLESGISEVRALQLPLLFLVFPPYAFPPVPQPEVSWWGLVTVAPCWGVRGQGGLLGHGGKPLQGRRLPFKKQKPFWLPTVVSDM